MSVDMNQVLVTELSQVSPPEFKDMTEQLTWQAAQFRIWQTRAQLLRLSKPTQEDLDWARESLEAKRAQSKG